MITCNEKYVKWSSVFLLANRVNAVVDFVEQIDIKIIYKMKLWNVCRKKIIVFKSLNVIPPQTESFVSAIFVCNVVFYPKGISHPLRRRFASFKFYIWHRGRLTRPAVAKRRSVRFFSVVHRWIWTFFCNFVLLTT